jgi:hypothetical protein
MNPLAGMPLRAPTPFECGPAKKTNASFSPSEYWNTIYLKKKGGKNASSAIHSWRMPYFFLTRP